MGLDGAQLVLLKTQYAQQQCLLPEIMTHLLKIVHTHRFVCSFMKELLSFYVRIYWNLSLSEVDSTVTAFFLLERK